ncbi:MAG: helix-turn-helix transcriptional regulator, partial [Synergistaceae bacterium]|nr:helix-turn-helix transcriptional regulator [Synergistaceae bacterium]
KLKLSQNDLEELTGIDANTFSRYERGVVIPSVEVAQKIASALNVSVDDLLNGPNDGKIRITLSYDWEKFQKGELEMDGNLFEVFLGGHGEVGIKGSGLPKSREELEELKQRMCKELDKAFDYQLERGAIQLA